MTRSLAVLFLAALLAGCAGPGSRDWAGGDSPGGVRWGGPYGGGGYGAPGGGYWRGRDYGYRQGVYRQDDDYRYRRDDDYRRPSRGRGYGGRTFEPGGGVICDRATETCYRGREIDASETREHFGRHAAREVDRIRDRAGTNRVFRPEDDVVCNRRQRVCLEDGRPSRAETREFFGKKAAQRVRKPRPDSNSY